MPTPAQDPRAARTGRSPAGARTYVIEALKGSAVLALVPLAAALVPELRMAVGGLMRVLVLWVLVSLFLTAVQVAKWRAVRGPVS